VTLSEIYGKIFLTGASDPLGSPASRSTGKDTQETRLFLHHLHQVASVNAGQQVDMGYLGVKG